MTPPIYERIAQALRDVGDFESRVYPSRAPKCTTAPYAVYKLVGGVPESTLSDGADTKDSRYQIDLYGKNYTSVQTSAKSVAAKFAEVLGAVLILDADDYEDELSLHRKILDFSIWHDN